MPRPAGEPAKLGHEFEAVWTVDAVLAHLAQNIPKVGPIPSVWQWKARPIYWDCLGWPDGAKQI